MFKPFCNRYFSEKYLIFINIYFTIYNYRHVYTFLNKKGSTKVLLSLKSAKFAIVQRQILAQTSKSISLNTDSDFQSSGVKLQTGTDSLGQQYTTPHSAIRTNKSDLIIVGRGITSAQDPLTEAEAYRQAGFSAYQERIS